MMSRLRTEEHLRNSTAAPSATEVSTERHWKSVFVRVDSLLGCCSRGISGHFEVSAVLLCVNARRRVLKCCVQCVWMAAGKSLCLHASPAQSNPNAGLPAGLFLFLQLRISSQTHADRASLANTKRKIFMCLQIWTTIPQSKCWACRNLTSAAFGGVFLFSVHSWLVRGVLFSQSLHWEVIRPRLKIYFLWKKRQ